jgi:hypothetical protein
MTTSGRLLRSLNRVGEDRRGRLAEVWIVGLDVSGFTAMEASLHTGHLTATRLLSAEGALSPLKRG